MSATLPTTATPRNGHTAVDAVTDAKVPGPFRARRRRRWLVALGATAAVLVLSVGVGYYLYARGYQSTDDAFIEGRVVQLSPRVSGHVLTVRVDDNQTVKAGDLLIEIDPRDYQAKVDQARAALQAAIARQHSSQINVGVVDVTPGPACSRPRPRSRRRPRPWRRPGPR
jgi:multidrug resistance efflux pump